jgi:hypothetical protein
MSAGDDYILLLIMLLLLGGGLSCLWLRGDANADVAIKGLVPRSALFLYPTVLLVLGFLPATSFFLFQVSRHNQKSWSYSLSFCFVIPTLIYGVLYFMLGKPLPLGVFVQWMEI